VFSLLDVTWNAMRLVSLAISGSVIGAVGRQNLTPAASDDGGKGAAVGQLAEIGGYRLVRELEHNFLQRGNAAS